MDNTTDNNAQVVQSGDGDTGNLDSAVHVEEKRIGVALSEQKAPLKVDRPAMTKVTKPILSDVRAKKFNNDTEWDLAKQLLRFNLVDTVTWATTDTKGTNLRIYDVVKDMLTNSLASSPWTLYHQGRWKSVTVRFEVMGNRYTKGLLMAYYWPTMMPKDQITPNTDLRVATNMQHAWLSPNQGTTVSIDIPFRFNRQYIDLVNSDTPGQLYLSVFEPLVSADGASTTATIKIYLSINEAVFKQPRSSAATFEQMWSRMRGLQVEKQSGILSNVIDSGAKALKGIVSETVPDDLIGEALAMFLDKPAITQNHEPFTRKFQGHTAEIVNTDFYEQLGSKGDTFQALDQYIVQMKGSETSVDHLRSLWSYVKTVDYTTTDAIGKVLFQEPVGINSEYFGVPVPEAPAGETAQVIDYVGNTSSYYAGVLS